LLGSGLKVAAKLSPLLFDKSGTPADTRADLALFSLPLEG
jgi:hypothetical protein